MSSSRSWLGACLFACLLLLSRVALAEGPARAVPPLAERGRLALAGALSEPVRLQGEWAFAWQEFVDPSWQTLPARAFAPVPASWNELTADGKPPGQDGWGSFMLQVDCPPGEALAVEVLGQRTASRLYVNGELVSAHGKPGPGPQASWAAVNNRIPISREFACPLRLTLHLSNYDHRAGGFVRPLVVGSADALARQREARLTQHVVLLTAYGVTGLVALIFFGVRRRERIPLAFGLFCLAMAVYSDMIGERLLLRPFPPQVSWAGYMQVEYLSWIAAMALFLTTLRGLFPREISWRVLGLMFAGLGVGALSVLLLPPGSYSQIAVPGQGLAVLVCGYLAIAMMRGLRHNPDARVLLIGFAAVLASVLLDLLLINTLGVDRKFTPIGFALFLLSPAVVIGRRMSHALNAEERGRTLEENARLREDVERISRHDLKTPLNSILGVTRLLRDDGRLTVDQRELVGVLQRASLRMLEMVNLSLGLYKMETGRYDFRPQAVDLREVVTRVLVDLHSLAEAGQVALHLRGSGRGPVYVRGEELLCYSIVANLVKNALEATAPGGQVTLDLQAGDSVQLAVHNPGVVPPELAARFFEKYVSMGKSGGTGLGTYSARLMARAQEGELELHSGSSEGTTVTLTLRPLQGELLPAAAPAPVVPVVPRLADLPPREVLLVDDDEFTRLVTRRYLPTPPFSVETADNGVAAMAAMSRRWPHILLLDMEMPLQGGIETVQWVRDQELSAGRPRVRVVMISGNDDQASAERARAVGADRFLVKPVSREALLAALGELELEAAGGPVTQPPLTVPPPDTVDPGLECSPEDDLVTVDPGWSEFFPEFIRMQRDTVEAMARALAAGDREDVHFLAHRATGGLATMGLEWAARQGRAIERGAHGAPVEQLQQRIEALRGHLRRVRLRPP